MDSHLTTKFDQIDWVTKFLIFGAKIKITQWHVAEGDMLLHVDMNIIFSCQNQYFTHLLHSFIKILFLPLENKIHSFAPPSNTLHK